MATQMALRRQAMALPNVEEATNRFAFSVLANGQPKGFLRRVGHFALCAISRYRH